MIRFFRTLRQQFLSENRASKYLLYAIGEILLVVIGILLALQINNWNEERKNRVTEKELLKALRTDFLETRSRLLETMEIQESVVSLSKEFLMLFETNNLAAKKDSLGIFVLMGALNWSREEPVTITYDAMVSTGNIGLLRNEELRRYLAMFDAEIKSGFEDHEHHMEILGQLAIVQSAYAINLYTDTGRTYIGLPEVNNADEKNKRTTDIIHSLGKNTNFFGLLTSKVAMDINRLTRQKNMFNASDLILNIIESELRN